MNLEFPVNWYFAAQEHFPWSKKAETPVQAMHEEVCGWVKNPAKQPQVVFSTGIYIDKSLKSTRRAILKHDDKNLKQNSRKLIPIFYKFCPGKTFTLFGFFIIERVRTLTKIFMLYLMITLKCYFFVFIQFKFKIKIVIILKLIF